MKQQQPERCRIYAVPSQQASLAPQSAVSAEPVGSRAAPMPPQQNQSSRWPALTRAVRPYLITPRVRSPASCSDGELNRSVARACLGRQRQRKGTA